MPSFFSNFLEEKADTLNSLPNKWNIEGSIAHTLVKNLKGQETAFFFNKNNQELLKKSKSTINEIISIKNKISQEIINRQRQEKKQKNRINDYQKDILIDIIDKISQLEIYKNEINEMIDDIKQKTLEIEKNLYKETSFQNEKDNEDFELTLLEYKNIAKSYL